MKRVKKINKKKEPKKGESSTILYFVIILLLFLIPFVVSYFFTHKYIFKNSVISANDEANSFASSLNTEDLNNLYLSQNKNVGTVPVLGYHQIREIKDSDTKDQKLFITSPEVFEREMKYLKDNNYTPITMTEYINYLENKNPIPKKAIVLTFDDGYVTQYQNAFPILKKYNMIGTFFIYSDCIDRYPICMTSSELKEMTVSGMKLANHTFHHVFLTDYKDKTIKKEIEDNQEFLENIDKENTEKVLAYPYGVTSDRVIEILKDLDYVGAVGVSFYAPDVKNIYNLPRFLLGDNIQNFYNILK